MKDRILKQLKPIAGEFGEVMYSPISALAKNEVYLLGHNPGGPDKTTIREHLDISFARTNNEWLDEKWAAGYGGYSPLQTRMWKLFENLELDLRTTPSSNLIFRTTRQASDLKRRYRELSDICWPVHQMIMEVVQPKKIIVFGNGQYESPYAFIRDKYQHEEDEPINFGANASVKKLIANIDGRQTTVIGISHPSRFVIRPEVVEACR